MAKGAGPIPDKNGKTIRRNENAQEPEGEGKGIHTFGPPPCSGRNRTGIAAVSNETDTGRKRKIAEMSVPGLVYHAACPFFHVEFSGTRFSADDRCRLPSPACPDGLH